MKRAGYYTVAISLVVVCCKKPYNPTAIASPGSYLVVEGVIGAGADSTLIKLSRTVNLSSSSTANPVQNAIVAVESDQNAAYPLTETTSGRYAAAGLNLDNTRKYRLSIKTANNEQYYSDYEAVLNSPPIDSLYYTIATNGINIYTAAHDATNTVKYYRWDYQASKRIFIANSQLPLWLPNYPYQCTLDSELYFVKYGCENYVAQHLIPLSGTLIPTEAPGNTPVTITQPLGYLASTRECVD